MQRYLVCHPTCRSSILPNPVGSVRLLSFSLFREFQVSSRGEFPMQPNGKTSSRISERSESLFQFERKRRQRRQVDEDRMFAAHPGNVFGLDAAEISSVAAAVRF